VGLIIGGFVFIIVGRFFKQPVLAKTSRHCMILALIFVPPAMFLGYLDWQHFYAGAWLSPIIVKMLLAGLLLVFVSMVLIYGRKPDNTSKLIMMYAICLATVVGLGYFGGELVYGSKKTKSDIAEGPALEGARIFNERCSACHYADKAETKIGPGLQGLFNLKSMPSSGVPVSNANIRKQLKTPFKNMPPFSDLPEEDIEALIAYLKTL
jgi:cytochrome c2